MQNRKLNTLSLICICPRSQRKGPHGRTFRKRCLHTILDKILEILETTGLRRNMRPSQTIDCLHGDLEDDGSPVHEYGRDNIDLAPEIGIDAILETRDEGACTYASHDGRFLGRRRCVGDWLIFDLESKEVAEKNESCCIENDLTNLRTRDEGIIGSANGECFASNGKGGASR